MDIKTLEEIKAIIAERRQIVENMLSKTRFSTWVIADRARLNELDIIEELITDKEAEHGGVADLREL